MLGPLAGGAAYQTLGLGGAYFLSAALYLAAGLTVSGLDFRQEPRKLRFGRIAIDISEAVAVAHADPAILAVVLVSIIMNMFAFSYSALIAPIGLEVFRVSPILVGALAAAEPLGAIAIGIPLFIGWIRLDGRRALLRGSLLFLIGLATMALSPWYSLAFVLLLIGGLGTAAFSNMQTTFDSHRSATGDAIARDGDRDDVYRHWPGWCGDNRHPIGTSRTSVGDPYHGWSRALRVKPGLEETDQGARRPMTTNLFLPQRGGRVRRCSVVQRRDHNARRRAVMIIEERFQARPFLFLLDRDRDLLGCPRADRAPHPEATGPHRGPPMATHQAPTAPHQAPTAPMTPIGKLCPEEPICPAIGWNPPHNNGPQVNPGDISPSWSAPRNVAESEQYDRLLKRNPAFRQARMRKECGPITDRQLHQQCLDSCQREGLPVPC